MQVSQPLVSIIIPVYNRAHLLPETLESVQVQTYPNWECLVVDDFSTDDTRKVINEFSLNDQRFTYLQNQHAKGAPGSRNTGLEYAKGDYISFFDSDDTLLPKYIENKIKYCIDREGLDLVISLSMRMEDGNETFYINVPTKIHPLVRFYSLHPVVDIPWINSTLIKKAFLLENNIRWDETVKRYQDIQFNVGMLSKNPSFVWSTSNFDNYWIYHSNADSIGSLKYDEAAITKKLIEVYWDNLQRAAVDDGVKKEVNRQYHAQLVSFCDQLAYDAQKDDSFFSFIKSKSHFTSFDLNLLKRRLSFRIKLPIGLSQRIHWKMIRMYFDFFYQPVVKEGHYLKESTLPTHLPCAVYS